MEWSEVINEHIEKLTPIDITPPLVQTIISVLDYTSLNATDTDESIADLCEQASTSQGCVAGVCVYRRFVRLVKASCPAPIKAVTVANFPDGTSSLERVLIEINQALEDGADEIDVVFPYHRYLAGERHYALDFISACKAACGTSLVLKVILETSALGDISLIADAGHDALMAGADFLKTSTGKQGAGASLEAAATLLLVIRHMNSKLKRPIGLKVSGGIREIEQAAKYLQLAEKIMGKKWVNPHTFRIGASQLLTKLVTWV